MNKLIIVGLLLASSAYADAIEDAKATKSVYYGSLDVDSYNPGHVDFETFIANQKVGLKLNSAGVSTTALPTLLGAEEFAKKHRDYSKCDHRRPLDCPNPEVGAVSFSKLAVFLNGCNISSEIVRLCGLPDSGCTIASPTMSPSSLGSSFSMSATISVNAINFGDLASTSDECGKLSRGLKDDKKFSIQFRELLNESSFVSSTAGKVKYQIEVENQAYASKR